MNKREIDIYLPVHGESGIILTNIALLKKKIDYDEVDVFFRSGEKRYYICSGGFAFDLGVDLFGESVPLELSDERIYNLSAQKREKFLLESLDDSENFFKNVLFEGKKHTIFYYIYRGETYVQCTESKYIMTKRRACCVQKNISVHLLSPEIVGHWENIKNTEYIPRLKIERYLINNGDKRKYYEKGGDLEFDFTY